jgi:DNA-repair protein complementing XP-A cells
MVEVCEVCKEEDSAYDLDPTLQTHFEVSVCSGCKSRHPEIYSLLPKTAAKKEFLLTEEELSDDSVLPHWMRPNPKSARWSNMQLYLRKHLIKFSNEKWGDQSKLEEERITKKEKSTSFKIQRFEKRVKELRKRTRLEGWVARKEAKQPEKHSHNYETTKDGNKMICTFCGFEIEFDSI